jgi:hypothetical protein
MRIMTTNASSGNQPAANGIHPSSLPYSLQQKSVDPRIAKLGAQGITLVAKVQTEERKQDQQKAVELYAIVESLSLGVKKLMFFLEDLKNPTIPCRVFLNGALKTILPKEVVEAIESSLRTAFSGEWMNELQRNPRILLQMKNTHGKNIIEHYLSAQKEKISEQRASEPRRLYPPRF